MTRYGTQRNWGVNKSAKLLEDEKRVEIIGLVILVTK